LGFLPQIAVIHDLEQGKLVAIEISNAETLRRNLDVIHPRHRPLSKDALAFLQLLRTAAGTGVAATHKPGKPVRKMKRRRLTTR
jgi:DNA-binding transcriptional LysR family regulator